MQERKHREAGEEAMQRQREIREKITTVTAQQRQCADYMEWLSHCVVEHLAGKVGRRIVLPPEFLF
jgi:hypothetical protein